MKEKNIKKGGKGGRMSHRANGAYNICFSYRAFLKRRKGSNQGSCEHNLNAIKKKPLPSPFPENGINEWHAADPKFQ
jgi:hypothetical protein